MSREYNDPAGGTPADVGSQIRTDHFIKKALIEARKMQFFLPLSGTTNLPKNMGKKIKKYHYLPLLDDANVNDQGIDAAGASTVKKVTFRFLPPGVTRATNDMNVLVITGEGANAAAAISAAETQVKLESMVQSAGYPLVAWDTNWDTTITAYIAAGWLITDTNNAGVGAYVAPVAESGNLYGSSKDIGTITGKLPALTENGGRVNRVGFKRKEVEGSIEKFGFFDEYTQESLDFDSDADLEQHINREMLNGASELTEDALQIDLLSSAGIVKYAGGASVNADIDVNDLVSYGDLLRLGIDLDNTRTPKHTKVATGTRLVDTKTIPAARVLYCGSELIPTLEAMTDLHSARAFIPVQQYGAGTQILNGEIGTVAHFRVVIVPEMLKWEGAGASATGSATNYETGGAFDVFPMLCVGEGAFSAIGFQTDGKTVKFKIKHSKPGSPESYANDPYGETGFMSIKWYYGFLLERSERIGLVKTGATL
jgi:N4-gp56 family major capsid protein